MFYSNGTDGTRSNSKGVTHATTQTRTRRRHDPQDPTDLMDGTDQPTKQHPPIGVRKDPRRRGSKTARSHGAARHHGIDRTRHGDRCHVDRSVSRQQTTHPPPVELSNVRIAAPAARRPADRQSSRRGPGFGRHRSHVPRSANVRRDRGHRKKRAQTFVRRVPARHQERPSRPESRHRLRSDSPPGTRNGDLYRRPDRPPVCRDRRIAASRYVLPGRTVRTPRQRTTWLDLVAY